MSKANLYKAPRGTFDILPGQSYKWQWITEKFREIASVFNYREIVTPIFEVVDLFERSVGSTTDIVEKEMYIFTDRKDRVFALRPEGTAPVVRSTIENHLQKDGNISKLFYLGPMFRYDRPQKGRYRQFYQYGIELIGSRHPYNDAEVIWFADMFVRNLGIKDFCLEINSIGCPKCSIEYDKVLVSFFSKYKPDLCPDCHNRIATNPKRLLDCKVSKCRTIAKDAPLILDYLDQECDYHFKNVCSYLDYLNIKYDINPFIVRGLDYYNRTAFEITDTSRKTQNALLGGGRYDGLFATLGGSDTPAIGFAGGFERLIGAMEQNNLCFGNEPAPDAYLIIIGDRAVPEGLKLIMELRDKGIKTEYNIEKNSLKAQMKAAANSKARYALMLGDDEIDTKTITIKDLDKGIQNTYPQEYLITFLIKS